LTIPLGQNDNVATLRLAPGYSKFAAFCAEAGIKDNHDSDPIIAQEATDEDDDGHDDDDFTDNNWKPLVPEREQQDNTRIRQEEAQDQDAETCLPCDGQPTTTDFNLDGENSKESERLPEVNIIEEDIQPANLAAKLLRVHHRMGHAPFKKLQEMARQGALPGRLKNCVWRACTGRRAEKPGRERPPRQHPSRKRCNLEMWCQLIKWFCQYRASWHRSVGYLPPSVTNMQRCLSTKPQDSDMCICKRVHRQRKR
jgi:hypothetical protein